jgi:hypothetical protein
MVAMRIYEEKQQYRCLVLGILLNSLLLSFKTLRDG